MYGATRPVADALPVLDGVLADRWDRRIRYLRVSITDRCNYRCTYCMPAEGFQAMPRVDLLSFEEIARFVGVMAGMGVERVRLTGGEPLVRRDAVSLVRLLAETPGIREVAMTTNGHLLSAHAQALHDAGLRCLTVSLDSFDPQTFTHLTRGGRLDRVLAGLAEAQRVGFTDIRINTVLVRDQNDAQLGEIVEQCWRRGWLPRFIELMPIGNAWGRDSDRRVTTGEALSRLGTRYLLEADGVADDLPRGPARYFRVSKGEFAGQRVGLISPMSDHGFCSRCNRARLTARGGLRACLADDHEVMVRDLLRSGASDAELTQTIREAVGAKREAHRMGDLKTAPIQVMTAIGG